MRLTDHSSLETILLHHDRRHMTDLRPYLPTHYCTRAARLALEYGQRVLITSGFYLSHLDAPETDGPPGALAVGRALEVLGAQVIYVTDRYAASLFCKFAAQPDRVIEFPIAGLEESQNFARQLVEGFRPTLVISIERCGVTAAGSYINARSRDITSYTARLDCLFQLGLPSIGIGDGGNEIGMGKLAAVIPTIPGLPALPAVTATDELIVSSVSNWGAYGLTAALSALTRQDLLPDPDAEEELIRRLFDLGCYDGTCDMPTCGVDGFTLAENSTVLKMLARWVRTRG